MPDKGRKQRPVAVVLAPAGDPLVLNPAEIADIARMADIAREDAARPDVPVDRAEVLRIRATVEFNSPDWSLGNVLSWIEFRDPAMIARFESRQQLLAYGIRSIGKTRREMLTNRPDQALLTALQVGKVSAIRDGTTLLSDRWFGKDVAHLTDNLRFRRPEIIHVFPAPAPITRVAADTESDQLAPGSDLIEEAPKRKRRRDRSDDRDALLRAAEEYDKGRSSYHKAAKVAVKETTGEKLHSVAAAQSRIRHKLSEIDKQRQPEESLSQAIRRLEG
jgi:hypothetical protein